MAKLLNGTSLSYAIQVSIIVKVKIYICTSARKTTYRQNTKMAIVAIVAIGMPESGSIANFANFANLAIYTFLTVA